MMRSKSHENTEGGVSENEKLRFYAFKTMFGTNNMQSKQPLLKIGNSYHKVFWSDFIRANIDASYD